MDKKTEKLLKKVGYFKYKDKYGNVTISNPFPNLKTGNHREKYPSLQGIAKTPGKKELPGDAKQFPIGYTHKSGLQLVTQFDDLKYMSGKKFLGKAKEILADYPNVDTRRNVFWQGEIGNLFSKEGFKKLGSGKYSIVFSHPKFNYIVKVFMKDAAFLKWYKFCIANPNNKFVPKFRGKIIKITDNFYALRMERLSSNSLDFDMDFLAGLAEVNDDAKQVYEFLMKHKNLLDMHGENVMMRGNQAVIIDPFYNWFDVSSKKYIIDPNDFDLKNLIP